MTALCDRLAELCGWSLIDDMWYNLNGEWPNHGYKDHPFPPNDYNALIAAWPEGWWWDRDHAVHWQAGQLGDYDSPIFVPDTGDEYADRLNLTVAAKEADRR